MPTQGCCTQSPCPCGRPPLTRTSTADAQTQFYLSLCGVPGSWYTQGLFQPSECLWREWSLILNATLPLLPSYWGFSDLGSGVFQNGWSREAHQVLQILDVHYLFTATPEKCRRCSWPWSWGIYSQPLQCHAATTHRSSTAQMNSPGQ